MNRKDFRPYDSKMSVTKSYTPRGSNKDVAQAFAKGKKAKSGSMYSTGDKLYSYGTVIATRQSDGSVVLNNTKYSVTISTQQTQAKRVLQSEGVKISGVTGGKDRGYEGEDFENTDRLRKYNYDVNNPEYKKEIEQKNKEDKKYTNIGNPYPDVSFKELSLDEKRKILSEQSYGKNYESLSSLQKDDVNNFLYKEHGMSVQQAEKEHKKYIKSNQYSEEKTHAKELKRLEENGDIKVGNTVSWYVGKGKKNKVVAKVQSTDDTITPQGLRVVATKDVTYKSEYTGENVTIKKGEILHPYAVQKENPKGEYFEDYYKKEIETKRRLDKADAQREQREDYYRLHPDKKGHVKYKGNPTNEQLVQEDRTNSNYKGTKSTTMEGIHEELMHTSKKYRESTPRSRETTQKRVHTLRNYPVKLSFKEKNYEEQNKELAKETYGKDYDSLRTIEKETINNFIYRTHGMDVRETEIAKRKFVNEYSSKGVSRKSATGKSVAITTFYTKEGERKIVTVRKQKNNKYVTTVISFRRNDSRPYRVEALNNNVDKKTAIKEQETYIKNYMYVN